MKPGKIIKWILIALLAAFFIFLFARIFMQGRNEVLTEVSPTENAAYAYKEYGSEAFTYHKFNSEISSDGYFSAYSMAYCEKTGELQLTSRYNDSLYNYLGVPEETALKWELRDSDGNTVSSGSSADFKENNIYNYTRLIFEDVKITDDTELYLFLICDECGYPTEKTKGFPVHLPGQQFKVYKLNNEEKAALA